jgi:hypothetical protein
MFVSKGERGGQMLKHAAHGAVTDEFGRPLVLLPS